MNNGKYNTPEYKQKQSLKIDRLYGIIEDHNKVCVKCNSPFIWTGRRNTKQFDAAIFCSRSCANNRQSWWNDSVSNNYKSTRYRSIARRSHQLTCAVCGFDKIVAIHHIDENKKNNEPSNLIPLCPNHHEMVHSNKWKNEVIPFIQKWQQEFLLSQNTPNK